MIRAVIFDCFGVLVTEGWLGFKDTYFSHDPELFERATDLGHQTDRGHIKYEDFVQQVADMAHVSPQEVNRILDHNVPNEPLFHYIKQLKQTYKIGILSNAADNWLEELFTPEQLQLFDATYLSYEEGIAKPDEKAFVGIAKRVGVEPHECVLVDDQERYCTAAREAGMQAVLYRGFGQLQQELDALLAANRSGK